MYAVSSEVSKELKRAVSGELWGFFFSPWKQKKTCCYSEEILGCSFLPFTEPTPFHNSLHYLKPLFLKRHLSMHVKYGAAIPIKEILKAVLKQPQINNVAISIKHTISDTVVMSSARNKAWPRAAVCTLFNISFAPLQLPMQDAK